MSRAKIKSADRVLSLILTVLMVLTMIPVSSLQAFAATIKNPDKLTVTVKDGTDAPVEGASVKITASGDVSFNLEGTTDADGETAFDPAEIKTLMETAGVELVKATLSVEKEGFVKYENEIDIKAENLAENHDVVLEAEDTSTATVTVTVTGSATVELNGVARNTVTVDAGAEVAVKITPAANSYIKSLTVGGEAASVEKFEAYEVTIKADKDVEIVAAVVKECVVTVKKNEGGSVYIGGNEVTGETYALDAGSNVVISAKADEGYVLSSVNIGGGNFLGFEGKSEFSGSFGISRNITVTVNFIKVHTIKVEHSANGTVVTNPVAAGNVISILDGKNVIIEATPEANFRVSEVTVNGVNEDVSGENNSGYKKEFAADGDYTIFITFAPNVFKVTAAETVNGKVVVGADVVEYDKNHEITVTPDDDYSVSSVKVNGVTVEEYTTDEDGSVIFTIENITEDKEIVAEFVETAKCDVDYKELFNDEDAIRNPGMTYIYKNSGSVIFTTDNYDIKGIILYDAEGNVIAVSDAEKMINISSDTEIAKIALRYKAEGEMAVMPHSLTSLTSENELRIVFDKTAPTASVTPDEPNPYGYYNKNVNVTVSAEDTGDFSGIAKIEYQIKSDDVVTQDWETIYTYNPEEGIAGKVENKQFTVVAEENNSDKVEVFVRVTDLAGNAHIETTEKILKINCTPPEVDISFNETGAVENIYDKEVTVTIKYTDRATTFNESAVLAGISIAAEDAAGTPINMEAKRATMISVDKKSQTATIKFDADANYTLTVNYKNNADMSAEEAEVKFTVDTTAPTARISLLGNSWNTLLETLTFGLYSANAITATVEATDATTSVPAENILYFVSFGGKTYTETELKELYEEGKFSAELNTVSSEERFVIYARVADKAGNATYVGTDGAVYDSTKTNIGLYVPVANRYGFYNSDVEIGISVSDGDKGSGIKTVEYSVAVGDVTTQSAVLYSFDYVREEPDENGNTNGGKVTVTDWDSAEQKNTAPEVKYEGTTPLEEHITETWTGKIKVLATENNADNVRVTVKVTDNAGNVSEEYVTLAICTEIPNVMITFKDEAVKVVDGRGYFGATQREGTIQIEERFTVFNAEAASAGATVIAKNANGEIIEANYSIGEWTSKGDIHTATIIFNQGEYGTNFDWSYSYTNKADKTNEKIIAAENETPFCFTVDMIEPYGTVSIDENVWDRLLSVLTFGFFSNDSFEISATKGDKTSPTILEYYVSTENRIMTEDELKVLYGEGKFNAELSAFDLTSDNARVVYVKITDYAGNYKFISSDGFVLDTKEGTVSLTLVDETNKRQHLDNPEDVNLALKPRVYISAKDFSPLSGLKEIRYIVYPENDHSIITQEGILYSVEYEREMPDGNGRNTNGGKLTVLDWNSAEQKNTELKEIDDEIDLYNQLTSSWSGYVEVDKTKNPYANVIVKVQVIDNAGNIYGEFVRTLPEDAKEGDTAVYNEEGTIVVPVDNTKPTINVTFDNDEDNNGNGYFKDNDDNSENAVRTATVVITEFANHFEAEKATNGIKVTAVDAVGTEVKDAYEISSWNSVINLDDPHASTHTATITFKNNANYKWGISYTDKAGNVCESVTSDSVAPFKFTIDTAEPDVTMNAVSYENNSEKRKEVWDNKFGDELIFGFWSKEEIRVSGTAKDDTSAPIASVEYYKVKAEAATDGVDALDYEALEKITDWKKCTVLTDEKGLNAKFDVLSVKQDEQFVVYLKVTDMAGNYRYVHSDGLIVDHTAPSIESIAPEITIEPVQPINGLYNDDVKVSIKVEDPLTGGTYSGLKTVKYRVLNMGKETQTGDLYIFDKPAPVQADLEQSISREITVDSKLNNSNDVEIEVYAQDNSLNAVTESEFIKIDISKPEIVVSYDNNNADSESYFKADRVATVDIYERNFMAEDVKFTIENTDGIMPMVSDWTMTEGTGNLDDTKWTATIAYTADGDYTFDVQYTDLANNKADEADYGNSVAPTAFTVDKTLPVINVSYDNNSAKNGKYFAEERTATIVVTEHNFILDRVEFTQTASLNGEAIAIPEAAWTHEGDVHTAVIRYPDDGDYTFDVKVTDMAGNVSEEADYGDSVAGKDFVVDLTIEKPVISGVENGCAYKEDVIPAVSIKDINFDKHTVELYRTRLGNIGDKVTDEFIGALTVEAQGASGSFDTFEKIVENDGIYTLVATVLDKAGNEDKTSVTFSVNRFGSVYRYNDYLVSLIEKGGQYLTTTEDGKPAIYEDLIITEYNADKLLDNSLNILITRDGKTIDAEVTPKNVSSANAYIGDRGWYEYQYVISKSNFAEDGVYRITLTSEYATVDSEKNESSSVPKNSFTEDNKPIDDTISFTVDTVAPEIRNIINLEKAIINDTDVEVKYTIVDVGGIKSIVVLVDGKEVSRIENFEDGGFNYSGSFELFENKDESKAKNKYEQNVRIVVTDLAGNVTDTAAEDFTTGGLYEFNKDVTISTNLFVRWYANKLFFWGSVGGTVVLAAALLFIIIIIKRKKDKEN